jgi:drug/metabolite transporter (DMT)-like permease
MPTKPKLEILPVLALLAATLFWGLLWFPMRWLAAHGLPGLWATALLFAAALAAGAPVLWHRRRELALRPGVLLGLLLSSGWCNTAFILAVLDGQVARVMLLFYLSPVWAVLLARLLLRERLPATAWLTLALALGGALIILWNPALRQLWPQDHADWLAITSGMAFALSNVFIRMGEEVSVALKTVVSWAGVALVAGILLALGIGEAAVWSVANVMVAVTLGVAGIGVVGTCLVYGVTHMPVHRSAVILLFEVVVGAVSAAWLAGERLGTQEWLGGILILIAAAVAGRRAAA